MSLDELSYSDRRRAKQPSAWFSKSLRVLSLMTTLGVSAGLIEEWEDGFKPQAANPFEGVKYDHLKKESRKKPEMDRYAVDCHLANSSDFRSTTIKGSSVDGRAVQWTDNIFWALENIGVPTTKENIQIAMILMHRESRMDTNPKMNVATAFKRKKQEMEERIRTKVPTKVLQDEMIALMDSEFAKYEAEIDAAKTEVDVYNALVHISNDFSYGALLAQKLVPYDPFDEKIAHLQDEMRVNTMGVLQVNPEIAIKYYASKGRHLNHDEAVDWLFTLSSNLQVGLAIFFTAMEEYEKLGYKREDAIKFAFADYNAGIYSSRNAAFQKMLSKVSATKLDTDGDLLIYEHDGVSDTRSQTELAVQKILPEIDVRTELLREKAQDFDNSEIYKTVVKLSKEKSKKSELAIIPDADDPDGASKYGKDFSAQSYTDEAMRQMRKFKWKKCK